MSGKVSDLPIRSKCALFRQKKLDRINFKSGKHGRVLRNPPCVTTGQGVSRVVGNVHDHMILCHMVLTRDPVMTIFGKLFIMCVQVVVTFMHVRHVSVLPPGIDVRKLQRSHSELSRVEPLSGLPSRINAYIGNTYNEIFKYYYTENYYIIMFLFVMRIFLRFYTPLSLLSLVLLLLLLLSMIYTCSSQFANQKCWSDFTQFIVSALKLNVSTFINHIFYLYR